MKNEGTSASITVSELQNMQIGDSLNVTIDGLTDDGNIYYFLSKGDELTEYENQKADNLVFSTFLSKVLAAIKKHRQFPFQKLAVFYCIIKPVYF